MVFFMPEIMKDNQLACYRMPYNTFDCETLLFQIFEATNAKRPKTKPEIKPMKGPVSNIITLGCLGMGMLAIISASFG